MKNRLTGVMALAMLLIVGLLAPASAVSDQAGQCDGFDTDAKIDVEDFENGVATWTINGYTVEGTLSGGDKDLTNISFVVYDGDEVVDGALVEFCLKGGTNDPAYIINASGSLPNGQDISNVVVYDVTIPEEPIMIDVCVLNTGEIDTISEAERSLNPDLYGSVDDPECAEEPDTFLVTFLKEFEGDEFDPDIITDLIFTVEVDGAEQFVRIDPPATLGELPQGTLEVADEDTVQVTGESIPGLNCAYTPTFPEPVIVTDDIELRVINDVDCDQPNTSTVTLVKEWFNASGEPVEAPDADWSVELFTTDENTTARLPDENAETDELEAGTEYGVRESLPMGWEEVNCDGLTDTVRLHQGTGALGTWTVGPADHVHLVCNQEIENEPATATVTLVKEWFGVDGERVEAPADVVYELELYTEDDTQAFLPGQPTTGELVVGTPYGVREELMRQDIDGDGWEEEDCDDMVTDTERFFQGTGELLPEGIPFTVPEVDSVHLVCNQRIEEAPVPTPTPTSTELPIIVLKNWTGDTDSDAFDASAVDVVFTIDGEEYEPGDTLGAVVSVTGGVVTEPTIDLEGEVVTGLDDELCSYAFVSADLQEVDEAGPWVLEVTNVVACGEDTETETIVEVLPEVIEAEPEAEPVVVAPEVVEVRGVTVTRAVPTSIDTGTGGYLPSSTPTAALLLLMLGGLALTGVATASLVRRRG